MARGSDDIMSVLVVNVVLGRGPVLAFIAPCVALVRVLASLAACVFAMSVVFEVPGEVLSRAVPVVLLLV